MGEWRASTWGDEVTLNYGKAIRGYQSATKGFRVYGSNGPVGWHDQPLTDGPGVILGRKGAYRGVEYSADPFFVIDTAYYVTPKGEMDVKWLYYAIKHHRLGEIDDGSPIPSTTRAAVYVRDFAVPPLGEQREIASVLSSLDDKIELNRRMNETLERQAQAIFRDWFVDFGPVRRKAAGEADPVAIMGGLTPDPARAAHLSALFPAAFGDDGLPVGWTLQPVSTFADIRGGKQLEKQHILSVGPNPVFGGAGIMGYATISNADGYVITVGRVGAYCGQFFGHRGAAWVNNNASLIKPSASTPPEWLLLALRESDIESIKRGAAQPFVSNGDVSKLPLVDASPDVRSAFEELTKPLFLLAEARQAESETLAETRDYLLPRLMSGAVRVDAQAKAA